MRERFDDTRAIREEYKTLCEERAGDARAIRDRFVSDVRTSRRCAGEVRAIRGDTRAGEAAIREQYEEATRRCANDARVNRF